MTREELRRRDLRAYRQELKEPSCSFPLLALFALLVLAALYWPPGIAFILPVIAGIMWTAWKRSEKRRFANRRFYYKWISCLDRVARLRQAMAKGKGSEADSLKELAPVVDQVSQSLYVALRRADSALVEIGESEGFRLSKPDTVPPATHDPTAARLWKVAQKTEEEYRRLLQKIMAGVERTEAQAALFVATMDTLRVKVLGARLSGSAAELESRETLQGLLEVRSQLDAIDRALEELQASPFAEIPEPPPLEEDGGMQGVLDRLGELSAQPDEEEEPPLREKGSTS